MHGILDKGLQNQLMKEETVHRFRKTCDVLAFGAVGWLCLVFPHKLQK